MKDISFEMCSTSLFRKQHNIKAPVFHSPEIQSRVMNLKLMATSSEPDTQLTWAVEKWEEGGGRGTWATTKGERNKDAVVDLWLLV